MGTEGVIVSDPLNRDIVKSQTSEPQDGGGVSPKIIKKITRGTLSCLYFRLNFWMFIGGALHFIIFLFLNCFY